MKIPIHAQGAGEFSRPGAKIFYLSNTPSMAHFFYSPRGLEGPDEHKAILRAAFD